MVSGEAATDDDGGRMIILSASRTSFSTKPPVFRRRSTVRRADLQRSFLVLMGIMIKTWEGGLMRFGCGLVWWLMWLMVEYSLQQLTTVSMEV